jgi:AcrR family transcriptional regulator
MRREATPDRILRAFLSLAAERGMAAVTTRDVARAADVNEVTLFRHFGDKATLALEAVRRSSPAAQIDAYQPVIDTISPGRTIDGLLRCLAELRNHLSQHPEMLQFGLGEAARYPDLLDELGKIPAAARRMLTRALLQAGPRLRPGVDIDAEVLGLLGTLLLVATWHARGWLDLDEQQTVHLLAARLRLLMRPAGPQTPAMTGNSLGA